MCLYFAYASNMLRERLLMSNISLAFVTVAKLKNYRLRFAEHPDWPVDTLWKGAMATIDQSEGDSVWGVVLELKGADLAKLDEQETVNKGFYHRKDPVTVSTPKLDPGVYTCFTYQMTNPVFGKKPSPQYLRVIRAGASQQCLPAIYQGALAAIEHNAFDGSLPIFDKIMKNIHF